MTATHGLGVYGNGGGVVTPLEHKMAQLGLITKTAANTIRAGLFYDGSSTVVTGTAGMSYDVRALAAVLSRGATAGCVYLTNDAVYNVATTAAPGSNSRYDVIYLWQREYSLDGTNSDPVIGVVQGTAAASPTVPSLAAFPGAIELARVLVPSGVTATNSGTTITQTAPFTSVDGGAVPFRNTTEMNAWTSAITNQRARDLSNALEYKWSSSAWVLYMPGSARIVPTAATNGSVSADGIVTSTAQSLVRVRTAFPTGYRVFRVSYDVTMSASSLLVRLANGATDATTEYDYQRTTEISTTVATVQDLNQGSGSLSPIAVAGARHFGEFLITDPNFAGPTYYNGRATVAPPAAMTSSTGATRVSGIHRTATGYDSFTLFSGSGNVTINRLTIEAVS